MLASNRFRISPIVESLLTREMPPNKWVGLYYYISVDLWSYFGRRPRCGCASVSACCPWRPEKGEPSRHGHEPKWSLRTIGTEYWSHGQHPCPTLVRHQLFPAFDNGQSRWPALFLMHPRGEGGAWRLLDDLLLILDLIQLHWVDRTWPTRNTRIPTMNRRSSHQFVWIPVFV